VRIDYEDLRAYPRDGLLELEEKLEGDMRDEYRGRLVALEEKREKKRKRKKKKRRRRS